MSKIRFCPHCLKEIPINQGFSFDDNLNLICENCGKVSFPTTLETERKVFKTGSPIFDPPSPENKKDLRKM